MQFTEKFDCGILPIDSFHGGGSMITELKELKEAAALFGGWQETMIWSCLQGVMGKVYGDSPKNPASASAVLGDFHFFAGKPKKEIILYETEYFGKDFRILVPGDEDWGELIESCFGDQVKKSVRYAVKKEPDVFDREKLYGMADKLPEGYTLKMIDEPLFWWLRETDWCRDWVAQYADYAAFQKYGLGVVMMKEGEPVSGASSYSGYSGGIEVEIDTREDCRRRGFASICGAKLILECLERGWYPSWDAHNRRSAALAEKLGYHIDHEYIVYEWTASGSHSGIEGYAGKDL